MGYPCLSLMAISAFIAASVGTHWPHEVKVEPAPSKIKQEEAEEESAPLSCKLCATKFAEAVRTCRGGEDTAKCFIRVWEVIEGQCLVIKMQNAMTCDWKVKRC